MAPDMPLDWSILRTNQPVDIAGNFARGYQIGQAVVDKYHERNALAALAQTPNDPAALSMLYQVNPSLGAHFEERGAQLQAAQRQQALGQQYASGDTRGAETAALSSGDTDLAKAFQDLDKTQQSQSADFWTKAGPIAYQLKQIKDPAQRQAFWAQAKPILQSEGVDTAKLNQFDPMNDNLLDAAITTSQKVSDLIQQGKIEWTQIPGDGGKIFAHDYMGRPVGSDAQALVNGGGASSGPPVTGTGKDGSKWQYNPQSKAWERMGGAGGNASGGFQ